MSKLNLDSFNDILFSAFKEQSVEKKIELLEHEISFSSEMFLDEVATLLEELDKNNYQSEQFEIIKNIMNNTARLIKQVEGLKNEKGNKEEHD